MLSSPPLTTAPVQVQVLTDPSQLHALRSEWDELYQADQRATVFQSWEWVISWYEHFGRNRRLVVMAARDPGGRLVGLAPASMVGGGPRPRQLHLLGRGNDLTEYVDVLLHPDLREVGGAIFDAWDQSSARWDLLTLPAVPADGGFVELVAQRALARGYQLSREEHVRMVRSLPGSWEAFYRSLKKSMKENVNNYVNRLQRDGHQERLVVVEDPARLGWALDLFLTLHQRRAEADLGRRHDDRFATPLRREFLRTVAARLFERGKLWPCLLEVDGVPVAAQLCLVDRGRLYTYYSGYEPAWAHSGVMLVLTRRCIEYAISRGCTQLDLLLGLDQEKRRWGAEPRTVVNLTLANRRPRSRLAFAMYRGRRSAAERWRRWPLIPGNWLRRIGRRTAE